MFKDKNEKVIYVGKAASLKARVRSYFQISPVYPIQNSKLVKEIADIDYIVTKSSAEALNLESNLIKEYKPKFNLRLKDDKKYPYIKISKYEEFPRISLTRDLTDKKAAYYGPYTDVTGVKKTLRLIKNLFPIRNCNKKLDSHKLERPCLNYYMKQCSAPCAGKITREQYQKLVNSVGMFLEGRMNEVLRSLKKQMKLVSKNQQYELAVKLREKAKNIEKITEKQKVNLLSTKDDDYIGIAKSDEKAIYICMLMVRRGKLIGQENFLLGPNNMFSDAEILESFIKQFYSKTSFIPATINVPFDIKDKSIIEDWLQSKIEHKVVLHVPKRGTGFELLNMASKNAKLKLESSFLEKKKVDILKSLKKILKSPTIPYIIEGFDVSNISGKEAVGAMVSFRGGEPDKNNWRRFKIKQTCGMDDYAMMREIVHRRYSRLLDECGQMPDLILIDGGRGHLSSAADEISKLGIDDVCIIALAKEQEHIFIKNKSKPIVLPRDSKELQLLQHIRDEAHRFAHSYHKKLRDKIP
ncbi:MAG: excinuclease ABC subunit UvrC [bacterium]|nr:excinuclease ABC subunit UvrC [bacterium]